MIKLLDAEQIIAINKKICLAFNNPHHCFDSGKIESALHSAFYPGTPPFLYGGVPKIAAAMAFFLVKAHGFVDGNKRTGALASTIFLDLNGFSLRYSENPDAFFDIINGCAAGQISKEDMIGWYDIHKVKAFN
jgi:death-on-curing protein